MRDDERDLRDALHARAAAVPVGRADEPGLGRRLAAARRRRQMRLAGAAALVVVAVAGGMLVATSEDQGHNVVAGPDPSSTTTVAEPSTTTPDTTTIDTVPPVPTSASAASTTPPGPSIPASGGAATTVPRATTTTAPLPPVPDDAVWPPPGSATAFPTADRAAADFARRYLGMGSPRFDPARVTGTDATVAVHAMAGGGPTTTVTLRRADRRGWVVLGCAADDVLIDQPTPGASAASPVAVRGRSVAFEAQVDVEVRQDGALAALGQTYAMGGSTDLQPYETTVTFPGPTSRRGAVLVLVPRNDVSDQGPASAAVVRVAF